MEGGVNISWTPRHHHHHHHHQQQQQPEQQQRASRRGCQFVIEYRTVGQLGLRRGSLDR